MGEAKKSGKSARDAASARKSAEIDRFAAALLARAPAEDVEAYEEADLARSAAIAFEALKRHEKGDSVIAVDVEPGLSASERPVSIVTVVNDNMPFLFDSVLGEITEAAGEPLLVLHPVVHVMHDKKGGYDHFVDSAQHKGEPGSDRVSVIHVHTSRLSAEDGEALAARVAHVLSQVRAAVADWKPMLARLDQAISEFRYAPIPLARDAVAEAIAFLEWLRDDNFTFLGMREFLYLGGERTGTLERADRPGLGILADPDVRVLRRGGEPVTTTPEIRSFLHGPDPLIVTKANAKSVVHRRIYLDYVGIKTFDAAGRLAGELRLVGLFTSTAYTRSVMKIPYLRSKVQAVVAKSGFDPADHSGKSLINVLESYPRDELFQIGVATLRKHAEAILALGERPRVRVLIRADQFDRFVSVIVFVPRDRYDSIVREKIGAFLRTSFDGRLSAYYPAFPEGGLARVHFIIGRKGGKTPKVEPRALEAEIRAIVRTWEDGLREAALEAGADAAATAIAARFPETYRNSFSPAESLVDAGRIALLDADNPIAIDYYRQPDHSKDQLALKIYHFGEPVPLSERVPLLENMGFRVVSERTFEIGDQDGSPVVFVHDMELESGLDRPIDLSDAGLLLEDVFRSIWSGEKDNDGYNALAKAAGLDASAIGVLRAYGRYLQQAGIPQTPDFISGVLNRYPKIAADLSRLFAVRFDPGAGEGADEEATRIEARIEQALEDVPHLDDDTIIRRFLNLIEATLRTNHFAAGTDAAATSLALKLDSRAVTGLPDPRPWREIFVYGPEVEGVHLRYGKVARGGLRWSDRAQDYRTEVLGLVKAQQVKNAVIVPVGAKGGFHPKRLPAGGGRDAVFEAGKSAYVNFVTSLLSVTDDLDGDKVVPPEGVMRRDGDDPYFVVAADKGTATFSDTANAISRERGFWLDDAFASGGSAGYDHKKMGITARGAWEAVKRHFREMNRDIQAEPFTAAGVGDMSGDVFGNGMLLSEKIRLVAAFDHRDIFIDPQPDEAASFAERKRLFDLPRSSWQDYDRAVLSEGGMVIARTQKSVTLTPEAAGAIGIGTRTASPAEIMKAVLKAPVDLLWFGGIGTYIRSASESNADAGDRANDAIRITGAEVGAKVIGEGANLGVTQRGRIEYALAGGRCNSDAIDNSGGVNSSDLEVNIKIALASAMRAGRLKRPARDRLLADMTDEVAALVLANNYRQTLALSLAERRGLADLPHQRRFMTGLEERGLLDRAVEMLPSDAALADRESRCEPLTRPELGVLLAYAKIVLFDDIVESGLPDQKLFEADLAGYFPARMSRRYGEEIGAHRLRREIVATELANDVVNRGGPAFASRLQDLTGCGPDQIVEAYAVVREGYALGPLFAEIDALDNAMDGSAQLDLYGAAVELINAATAWHLKYGHSGLPLGERVALLKAARRTLEPKLPGMLSPFMADKLAVRTHGFFKSGAPEPLAERLALLEVAELVPDIALAANEAKAELVHAAEVFFAVTERFRIGRIGDAARSIVPGDYYDGLAISRAGDMIGVARRTLASEVLSRHPASDDPLEDWMDAGGGRVARIEERLQTLAEGGEINVSRLTVAAGLMADLTGF